MSGGRIAHHTQLQYGYLPWNEGSEPFTKENAPSVKIYYIIKVSLFAKEYGTSLSGSWGRGRICRGSTGDQFRAFRHRHRGRLRRGSGVARMIIPPAIFFL